jgi:hypothetical protein
LRCRVGFSSSSPSATVRGRGVAAGSIRAISHCGVGGPHGPTHCCLRLMGSVSHDKGGGRVGGRRRGRTGLPTGLVSSGRRIEPCMRFSRTRLSDVLDRWHSASRAPRPVGSWRDDGSLEVDQPEPVGRLVDDNHQPVAPVALVATTNRASDQRTRPAGVARDLGRRVWAEFPLRARLLGLSTRRLAHGRPTAGQDRKGDPIPRSSRPDRSIGSGQPGWCREWRRRRVRQ